VPIAEILSGGQIPESGFYRYGITRNKVGAVSCQVERKQTVMKSTISQSSIV